MLVTLWYCLCLFYQVFQANYDQYFTHSNQLDPPIVGRAIRINPATYNAVAMRVEIYGCPSNQTVGKYSADIEFLHQVPG